MPTTITHIIDPDNGAGPPTTDYTSIASWETAQQRNLVTADEIARALCRASGGTADSTKCNLVGWTTDSTRYITVENDDDPLGVYNTSHYRIEITNDSAFHNVETHSRFINMQARVTTTDNGNYNIFYTGSQGALFDRCIGKESGSSGTGYIRGFNFNGGSSGDYQVAVNCLCYDLANASSSAGFYANTPQKAALYYCTSHNMAKWHFVPTSSMLIKNCIADTGGIGYTGASTRTACLSSDGTGTTGLQNKNPTYVNEGGDDFHLQAGSDGEDAGVDLSADSAYAVSTDVDGDSRSSTPDVGFDEILAVTGQPIGLRNLNIPHVKTKSWI